MFPKNEIYLLTSIKTDEKEKGSIDRIKNLKKIEVDEDFLESDLDINDFANSLVIFDDIDTMKPIFRSKCNYYMDMILETGRHKSISCFYCVHLPTKGLETKRILNESHYIFFKPNSLLENSKRYFMEKYLGLNKQQRNLATSMDNGMLCFITNLKYRVLCDEKRAIVLRPQLE